MAIYISKPWYKKSSKRQGIWVSKTWGIQINGQYIWNDGDDIYYSSASTQKVLDRSTSTWKNKTWKELTSFNGTDIWKRAGSIIYYSSGATDNYKLSYIQKDTWDGLSWKGLPNAFKGRYIWNDGTNYYFSNTDPSQLVFTNYASWSSKTWYGLTSFLGDCVWKDGNHIYYSLDSNQYELDVSTSTWNTKTWNGLTSFRGRFIWTIEDDIYYSYNANQYKLNKSTSTWIPITWEGYTPNDGRNIWKDGDHIYYSYPGTSYELI